MELGKAKEPKQPKAPKEKKPKKPKKEKPPKVKKGKKGQPAPEAEGQEQEQGKGKKKLPLPFLLISIVVIIAAAAIVIFVVLPKLQGGEGDMEPDASESVEPLPPELPETIMIGETSIAGMTLEADESGAQAEKSKLVIYRYTNLVNAGKAAETYVGQLAAESPAFSVVDEEFVRTDRPDFTAQEGMVLMARNVPMEAPAAASAAPEESSQPEDAESPDPEASGDVQETASPAPEESEAPADQPTPMVLSVRIEWAPGTCVVTANEEEGRVTSPPPSAGPSSHTVTQRGAKQILQEMEPAQLGLVGASMEEYEVMPVDGTELVDDRPCIRLYVYSDNNQPNSNEFMGSYLMSVDGEHLYKVDPVTDEIKELDYTPQ